jgi:hypothetical protein
VMTVQSRAPDGTTETYVHLLTFPAFLPTALPTTYVGARVGGEYQTAPFSSYLPIGGKYQRAIGNGAIDFSLALIRDRIALFGSLAGDIATGANPSTILGQGAALGGGLDIGFLIGTRVLDAGRIALSARAMERHGLSLLVERGFTAIRQNPIHQTVENAARLVGDASGKIAVIYHETGNRIDGTWIWAASHSISFYGLIGLERTYGYYRNDVLANAPEMRKLVLPRLGAAFQYNLSTKECSKDCWPWALLLEYELSPTRLWIGTLDPRETGPAVHKRIVEHIIAAGLHYASYRYPDFDVGLTFYSHLNIPLDYSLATGAPQTVLKAWALGGQIMARYCWQL